VKVAIVGWHIHPEAAVCDCGEAATVVAMLDGDYTYFNLCDDCLGKYEVVSDKIDEVFKNLGL
jgi:hypothetical protein